MKRREFNKTLVAGAAGIAGLGAAVPEKKPETSHHLPEWFKSAAEFMKKPLLPKQRHFFDEMKVFRKTWERPQLTFYGNPRAGKTYLILYAIAGAMLGSYPFPTDVAVLDGNPNMRWKWVERLKEVFSFDRSRVISRPWPEAIHLNNGDNLPPSIINLFSEGENVEGMQFDAVFTENCWWNDSKEYRALLRAVKPHGYSICTYDLTHQG